MQVRPFLLILITVCVCLLDQVQVEARALEAVEHRRGRRSGIFLGNPTVRQQY